MVEAAKCKDIFNSSIATFLHLIWKITETLLTNPIVYQLFDFFSLNKFRSLLPRLPSSLLYLMPCFGGFLGWTINACICWLCKCEHARPCTYILVTSCSTTAMYESNTGSSLSEII